MGNFVIGLLALLIGLACAMVFGMAMGWIVGTCVIIAPVLWLMGRLRRIRSTSD